MKTLVLIIICIFYATTYANATSYEQNHLERTDDVVILQRKIQTEPEKSNTSKMPSTTTPKSQIKPTVKMTIIKNPVSGNPSRKSIKNTTNTPKSCKDTPGTKCYRIKHRAKARPYAKGNRYKHPSRPRPKQPAKPIEFIHCY